MGLDLRKRSALKKIKKINTGTNDDPKHKTKAKQEQSEGPPIP